MKILKLTALGLGCAFMLHATSNYFLPELPLPVETTRTETLPTGTEAKQAKKIKVALLIDTSNSMDGLIEQAKSQLWSIVNELALAESGDMAPDLQIALYQYGNDNLLTSQGFIQQVAPFTTDLDLVSEKLFGLTTNGGSEFCGQAIQTSLNELTWGDDDADYKTIFIAGNEPFDQGSVTPASAFNLAKRKDVFVNAIYCGMQASGLTEGWNAARQATAGTFLNIDANQLTAYVGTPYDAQIADLNTKLNPTYLWYGSDGKRAFDNMYTQDNNAANYGMANMVNRAITKNGRLYNDRNENWDLVDKLNADPGFKVSEVATENLPEEMRKMTAEEKQMHILKKKTERAAINLQIAQLGEKRAQYLAAQNGKGGADGSFQNAILAAIQDQAKSKGFTFAKPAASLAPDPEFVPAMVDFDYFMEIAAEVKAYRKDRLVDFNKFLSMSKQPGTIILDTRSKANYDALHIKGALHLNFADFNVYDLARLIPDPNTRILIYCNNNIDTGTPEGFDDIASETLKLDIERTMVSKGMPISTNEQILKLPRNSYSGAVLDPKKTLALNIPTFINLYGYGYRNVYELSQLVRPNDPRLVLEGNSITAAKALQR